MAWLKDRVYKLPKGGQTVVAMGQCSNTYSLLHTTAKPTTATAHHTLSTTHHTASNSESRYLKETNSSPKSIRVMAQASC